MRHTGVADRAKALLVEAEDLARRVGRDESAWRAITWTNCARFATLWAIEKRQAGSVSPGHSILEPLSLHRGVRPTITTRACARNVRSSVKLNHLDLQVADVPVATAFLVDHFDLRPLTRPDSPAIAILTDGEGFVLVLQRLRRDSEAFPEGFHIGFLVDDPDQVVERRARLAAAGLDVSEVQRNARGTMCFCRGPSGLLIEVGCRVGVRAPALGGPPR